MPVYKIADIVLTYEPKYEMLRSRSEKYIFDGSPDFRIGVTDNLIKNKPNGMKNCTDEVMEYLWMGLAFNVKLLEYSGMFLHSSTVVVDGKAYSFSAPCGTGKSTHTNLWLKLFGDKAYIINDDKAAYRLSNNKIYAYGTPFSGKNDISVNTKAELNGICFIERGETNSIERISPDDALPLIISQTVCPEDTHRTELMLDFIDRILADIPIYRLRCNMNIDAAELSYDVMSNKK